jgi:hypothetical protein
VRRSSFSEEQIVGILKNKRAVGATDQRAEFYVLEEVGGRSEDWTPGASGLRGESSTERLVAAPLRA